jgi:3-dehydroquinate synthase
MNREKTGFTIQGEFCPVYTGIQSLEYLSHFIEENTDFFSQIYILTDSVTLQFCLPLLKHHVSILQNTEILTIESGEKNKVIGSALYLWKELLKRGADRHSLLINLGGGMICDMGGFVAANFKRGISFVHIPTTLLSMVDASIGGKTGVDFDEIKNQIGVFALPKAVFINPQFLDTLPMRQIKSGMAEMLKHGLVADATYWQKLSSGFPAFKDAESVFIAGSVKIKCDIVNADPMESGLRKVLNFGHTIGHALEAFSLNHGKESLLHGEAIAAGMICEAYISHRLCGLPYKELQEIIEGFVQYFSYYHFDNKFYNEIAALTQFDKKNRGSKIGITLLKHIGETIPNQFCDVALIIESLEFYSGLSKK